METTNDDLMRKICDKKTLDALSILKTLNKEKHTVVEQKILAYFNKTRSPVDFNIYLELLKNIDDECSVSFQRKKDCYSLDEIDDDL